MRYTEKQIRLMIKKYLPLFGDIPMINHIITDNVIYNNDNTVSPAMLIGPIDDEYGLVLNQKSYIIDSSNVRQLILHEMIHYYLLLNGKQKQGKEQHNDDFVTKAKEVEEKTGLRGINIDDNYIQRNLRYKNHTFHVLRVITNNGDILYTRFINKKLLNYFKRYISLYYNELNFKKYEFFNTNISLYEQVPVTIDYMRLSMNSLLIDK